MPNVPSARLRERRGHESSVSRELLLDIYSKRSARDLAETLKRAADSVPLASTTPLRAAVAVLDDFRQRAGPALSAPRRRRIELAKKELRSMYREGRD